MTVTAKEAPGVFLVTGDGADRLRAILRPLWITQQRLLRDLVSRGTVADSGGGATHTWAPEEAAALAQRVTALCVLAAQPRPLHVRMVMSTSPPKVAPCTLPDGDVEALRAALEALLEEVLKSGVDPHQQERVRSIAAVEGGMVVGVPYSGDHVTVIIGELADMLHTGINLAQLTLRPN